MIKANNVNTALGRDTMNMLRTDRTYATYDNAMAALRRGCVKLHVDVDSVRYVIAANEAGRFAPAVLLDSRIPNRGSSGGPWSTMSFIHAGITVIG
jgi:hypothetical protein